MVAIKKEILRVRCSGNNCDKKWAGWGWNGRDEGSKFGKIFFIYANKMWAGGNLLVLMYCGWVGWGIILYSLYYKE